MDEESKSIHSFSFKQLYHLIPSSYRKKGIGVFGSVLFRALLDYAGVAALIPILLKILDNDSFPIPMIWICLAILVFVAIKNLILVYINRYQGNYLLELYRFFSESLYLSYYRKGLLYIKSGNTFDMAYQINTVCYSFVSGLVFPVVRLLSEILLFLFILISLLVYAPQATVILVLVLSPIIVLHSWLVRRKMTDLGRLDNEAKRLQGRLVQDTFRGYPEIEIGQAFPKFFSQFESGLQRISSYQIQMRTISSVAVGLLEIGTVLGLIVLMWYTGPENKLFFGVFAVAALKLWSAAKVILGNWTTIRNTWYTMDMLQILVEEEQPAAHPLSTDLSQPLAFNREICVEHLHFGYEPGQVVIDDFNLVIHKGESVGIKGVSGVGKSTLFNLLLGFFPPQEGQIRVDDVILSVDNMNAWHALIGYVPQTVFISNRSLAENIALGELPDEIDTDRIYRVLEQVCLKDWLSTLPDGLATSMGEFGNRLSGGQKQRIGIARALYKKASVLFFDEATSSVDNQTEQDINMAIRDFSLHRKDLTVLVIAHRDTTLSFCDRIVELSEFLN